MGLGLAVEVVSTQREIEGRHSIDIRLTRASDGSTASDQRVEFDARVKEVDDPPDPEEDGSVAVAVPLLLVVPEPGLYRIEVEVDSGKAKLSTGEIRAIAQTARAGAASRTPS
jgi:hypothetical protein